jgi:hypothetical protein
MQVCKCADEKIYKLKSLTDFSKAFFYDFDSIRTLEHLHISTSNYPFFDGFFGALTFGAVALGAAGLLATGFGLSAAFTLGAAFSPSPASDATGAASLNNGISFRMLNQFKIFFISEA